MIEYDLTDFCFENACIKKLLNYDGFTIKHKRGDTNGAHLIVDVFLEGDMFIGYHCDTDIIGNGDTHFHFRRRR